MITVRKLVSEFLGYNRVLYKAKTVSTYNDRLKPLVALYGTLPVCKLNHKALTRWIEYASHSPKKDAPMSSCTVRMTISITRRLIRFAFERRYIRQPVLFEMPLPADVKRERIPTRREQRAILAIAPRPFRRIYQALRLSGARPSELCNANIEDYHVKQRLIVLGDHKEQFVTGKQRKITVGRRFRHLLRCAIRGRTTGPIFLTAKGNRWNPQTLSHKFLLLRRKAEITDELCLYAATRHEHGSRMTTKHGIFAASKSLGHASVESTMRYAHLSNKQLCNYQDDL